MIRSTEVLEQRKLHCGRAMDDSSSCRVFETTMSSELGPIPDIILGQDRGGCQKRERNHDTSADYGDIHNLSAFPYLLPQFDEISGDLVAPVADLANCLQQKHPQIFARNFTECKLEGNSFDPSVSDAGIFATNSGTCVSPDADIFQQRDCLEAANVFGRVTFSEGKLTVQLRYLSTDTNYFLSVGECWLCGDKIVGSCGHKHILHGLFRANTDYVQLDIDHFLMPSQILETSDSIITHKTSNNIAVEHNLNPLNISDIKSGMRHHHPMNDMNLAYIPSVVDLEQKSHLLTSENPVLGAVNIDFHPTSLPLDTMRLLDSRSMDSVRLLDASLSDSLSVLNGQGVLNPVECMGEDSSYLNSGNYSYHSLGERKNSAPQASSNTVSTSSQSTCGDAIRKPETGAKKRKSKAAHRKPSAIQFKGETQYGSSYQMDYYSSEHYQQMDWHTCDPWARRSLVSSSKDNIGSSSKTFCKIPEKTSVNPRTSQIGSKLSMNKPRSERTKRPEVDQTSRLASHMLLKGLDLTCRICQKEFQRNVKLYRVHMHDHGVAQSDLFSCCFCPKLFAKPKYYTQHLRSHVKTNRLVCSLCGASFSREEKLRAHMAVHRPAHDRPVFTCPVCTKKFFRKECWKRHMARHGGVKPRCDLCHRTFSNAHSVVMHKRTQHMNDKPFKCELCDKLFPRRDFLDNHMDSAHKNKKFKCEQCCNYFSRKGVLLRHMAIHRKEAFNCDLCTKKFSRKDRLVCHKNQNHGEAKSSIFKCSECPVLLNRKELLRKHMALHKAKQQCSICHKFFSTSKRLEDHAKCHEGQNVSVAKETEKVKCDVCDKFLSSREVLRKHLRRVHDVFPPAGISKNQNINNILLEKDNRFFCSLCPMGFTRSCNLRAHQTKHHQRDLECSQEKICRPLPHDDEFPSVFPSRLDTVYPPAYPNHGSYYHGFTASNTAFSGAGHLGMGPPNSDFSLPVGLYAPSPSPPPSQHPLTSHTHTSGGSPDLPINLSTDAITAAAYLLAYPSYVGPY